MAIRVIKFYRTDRGDVPVAEFLDELDSAQAKKVTWVMQLAEDMNVLPKQYFKKLKNTDDIWEMRIIHGGNIFRILGFFADNEFIVTNGFQKKTQKTPKSEIRKAKKSKQDYLMRFKDE